jgi:hypothetical protein
VGWALIGWGVLMGPRVLAQLEVGRGGVLDSRRRTRLGAIHHRPMGAATAPAISGPG